jgi:type IV secretion system protein VirD4
LGKETILVEGWNDGESWSSQPSQHGRSTSHTRNRSRDIKQQPRELLQLDEVMNLDERIAITFTPGKPPIWTWLTRYYERGWNQSTGLSPAKMIFDAACLFLAAGMLAAMWTAGLYFGNFR